MLSEGQGIQGQFIWCADLSCLARSSNHTNEIHQINQIDQMNQIPATRREISPATVSSRHCSKPYLNSLSVHFD